MKRSQKIWNKIQETHKLGPHPWYGPCDGLALNGGCGECERVPSHYFWQWLLEDVIDEVILDDECELCFAASEKCICGHKAPNIKPPGLKKSRKLPPPPPPKYKVPPIKGIVFL